MRWQGAGHNDVELYSQYLERLKQFVSVELANWQGNVVVESSNNSSNNSSSQINPTEGSSCSSTSTPTTGDGDDASNVAKKKIVRTGE